ncbi:MAG: GNAT family N-acetyltransferase [Armatimonadetes bacterium]|nr:GNAT family N-acetyltransferase [Armatimonadota bacterium]
MPQPERFLPQLVMGRPSLDDLPSLAPPPGYHVRSFRPGDEVGWARVISDSFGQPLGPEDFHRRMGDGQFRPERVWFVADSSGPVATASAWLVPRWGEATGVLHMVGVMGGHTGQRLGRLVSLAALRQMQAEGRQRAVLQTDDHRLPAIRTYLGLGFEPYLIHESQRARWRVALAAAGVADGVARLAEQLDGPLRTLVVRESGVEG